jgi:spore maturation protein CgeB
MKIVIFGLSVSSAWGNGHATHWRGLCRELGKRGHRVIFFERDVPYYAEHRDLTQLLGASLILYDNWKDILPLASHSLDDADVGLVTSYCGDAIAACELVLDSRSKLRVFYDLDTPITLESVHGHGYCSYLPKRGLNDFDLVFSYTGGRALSDLQTDLGARRVAALYGSVDPSVHRPVFPMLDYHSDLSHLGTYAEDRRAVLDELLIEPASRCPHQRFLIGGPQYPQKFMWRPNMYYRSHVSPAEHSQFYCSSRFTLNVTRRPMARMGFCPSNRLFEAAACGVPIISDLWEGLDQFFEPDDELIVARCADDVVDALGLNDEERRRIGKRARERALSEHTAAQRAIQMENTLGSVLSSTAFACKY